MLLVTAGHWREGDGTRHYWHPSLSAPPPVAPPDGKYCRLNSNYRPWLTSSLCGISGADARSAHWLSDAVAATHSVPSHTASSRCPSVLVGFHGHTEWAYSHLIKSTRKRWGLVPGTLTF